jgi:hypothetical protein
MIAVDGRGNGDVRKTSRHELEERHLLYKE